MVHPLERVHCIRRIDNPCHCEFDEHTWLVLRRVVIRLPKSVEEPIGIGFNSVSILVAVPTVVSMSSIFNIEHCVAETSLPVS